MGEKNIQLIILDYAKTYIKKLSAAKIINFAADLNEIRLQNFEAVHAKKLRGPIQEIIFGHHRFTYFQIDKTVYIVRGFRKKTNKTPKTEIEYAEKIYKMYQNNI